MKKSSSQKRAKMVQVKTKCMNPEFVSLNRTPCDTLPTAAGIFLPIIIYKFNCLFSITYITVGFCSPQQECEAQLQTGVVAREVYGPHLKSLLLHR